MQQEKPSEIYESPYYSEIKDQETTYTTKNIPQVASNVLPTETSISSLKNITRPPTNSSSASGTIFVSGPWKYHYKQYNQYFGPFSQELHFNSRDKTVIGHGVDNVGQYALNGTFSEATGQIEMRQTYRVCLLL